MKFIRKIILTYVQDGPCTFSECGNSSDHDKVINQSSCAFYANSFSCRALQISRKVVKLLKICVLCTILCTQSVRTAALYVSVYQQAVSGNDKFYTYAYLTALLLRHSDVNQCWRLLPRLPRELVSSSPSAIGSIWLEHFGTAKKQYKSSDETSVT